MLKWLSWPALREGRIAKRISAFCMAFGAHAIFVSIVHAQDMDTQYEFHIKAESLGEALDDFVEQTGLMVLFPRELADVEGMNSVIGTFSASEALDQLFMGTAFSGGLTQSGAIFIAPEKTNREDEMASGKLKKGLLASVAAFVFGASAQAQDVEVVSEAQDNEKEQDVIVVTGTNIRGVEATGASALMFDRLDLDNTGFSSTEDFFESLPQNLDEISPDATFGSGVSRIAAGNSERGSSISLRGLGPGSTLVLLNGKRRPGSLAGRVFDVSAIPLSMIERIEVVTGGRSAIYGSDAVAGVVNIVTRTEYDGAETQVLYGAAKGGAERLNVSQTFGRAFDRGGFVLGYDYRKDLPLDAADTGLAETPSPATTIPGLFDLRPFSEQHSGIFSGHFDVTDHVEIYADAHVSFDENEAASAFTFGGLFDIGGLQVTHSNQYSFSGGVRVELGNDWQLDTSGQHGVVDNGLSFSSLFVSPGTITTLEPLTERDEDEAKLTLVSAVADGPLFDIGGREISAAIGFEFRDESYQRVRLSLPSGVPVVGEGEDNSRDIFSFFGEVYLPLVDEGDHRLDVSIAGRYDEYSDFGGTFNPQFGVEWEPLGGLIIRGSYSEAFRVPSLFDLVFGNQTVIDNVFDPVSGNTIPQFTQFGGNPGLNPEEAETWTVGTDWEPVGQTRFSLSYFNISYTGRIDQPLVFGHTSVLANESDFADLINRNPTSSDLTNILDVPPADFTNQTGVPFDPLTDDPLAVFPDAIIFDNRRGNIGLEAVDGIDFQASTVQQTKFGDWSFGLNGTYYLNFERNVTATSPTIDQLNEPGKIIDLRIRGNAGWSLGAWSINGYVNYVDSYNDTLAATPTKIDSWTTVDLTLRFDASEITTNKYLDGFRATLGVDNVFDTDPPFFGSSVFGLGFDATNADPLGRFVSLRLSQSW